MKEENQAIIKALNMFGRVPEMWELLEEIEKLKKKLEEKDKEIKFLKQSIKVFTDKWDI